MTCELTDSGCTLTRKPGDPALSHESNTAYHMKRLLNAQGYHFVRINPEKHGLTSCKVGLWDRRAGIMLWHERYQIEAAHKAFNAGAVRFQRVNTLEAK